MVVNPKVVILDEFNPSPLSHVQFPLGENILQTLMVRIDLSSLPHLLMPPNFEGKYYGGQLKVMSWVVFLMRSELSGQIRYHLPFLHQYTPESESGCVTINFKVFVDIWHDKDWHGR